MLLRQPSRFHENLLVVLLFVALVIYLILSANGVTPFVYAGF